MYLVFLFSNSGDMRLSLVFLLFVSASAAVGRWRNLPAPGNTP
jgi:hypothetical protein